MEDILCPSRSSFRAVLSLSRNISKVRYWPNCWDESLVIKIDGNIIPHWCCSIRWVYIVRGMFIKFIQFKFQVPVLYVSWISVLNTCRQNSPAIHNFIHVWKFVYLQMRALFAVVLILTVLQPILSIQPATVELYNGHGVKFTIPGQIHV
jgi:hypothetical protein